MSYGDVDKQETSTRREQEWNYRSHHFEPRYEPTDRTDKIIELLKVIAFCSMMTFFILIFVVSYWLVKG